MIKERKIAVIGLGYVGLPLAAEFAKSSKVWAFDINKEENKEIKSMNLNVNFNNNDSIRILIGEVVLGIPIWKSTVLGEGFRLVMVSISKSVTMRSSSNCFPLAIIVPSGLAIMLEPSKTSSSCPPTKLL